MARVLFSERRRWVLLGLLLVAVFVTIELLWLAKPQQLRLVTRLNSLLYDARFTLLPPQRDAKLPIVIIDLDEFSLQREGRWPWARTKVAELVVDLKAAGVLLMGMDMVFSEPSRDALTQVLKHSDLPAGLAQKLKQHAADFSGDQVLANAVGRRVVLGYFLRDSASDSVGQLPFPFYRLSEAEQQRTSLLTMTHYTANLPLIANHALGQGFVVAVPDIDGVVRRVPLVIRYQQGVYASLPLAMARLALGARWIKLSLVDNGSQFVATSLNIGNKVRVPLSANGSLLVPFRGYGGSFPTISATRVLQGDLSATQRQQLNGAIALVGTSALGLSDLRTIPLQTAYPGVEVHANVLDAILQSALGEKTFYVQPDWTPAVSVLLLLVVGLLMAFLLPGRSPLVMLTMALCCLLLVVGSNAWLWQVNHFALPLALPLLLVLVLSAFNLALGFWQTSRNKREMEGLFGEYVPAEYVKLMLTQPDKATMEGEQRDMTVLFADVCGFTSLSEALTTIELKQLLNRYLTEVTAIIFDHRGTIDKYVGDMVMAFWNAPLDDKQHPQHGVLTALAMQDRVAALRDVFVAEGLPSLAIGVGVNSGLMNVGDMGSSYRRAYTVLGDAVNLGSRLEGLTRYYGVEVLVSEVTLSQCDGILFRPIDRIRVKGKDEPVDVFEPLGLRAEAEPWLLERVACFEEALAAYREARFAAAKELLASLCEEEQHEEEGRHTRLPLYRLYLARIAEFAVTPPAADWQAVFTHTSK